MLEGPDVKRTTKDKDLGTPSGGETVDGTKAVGFA